MRANNYQYWSLDGSIGLRCIFSYIGFGDLVVSLKQGGSTSIVSQDVRITLIKVENVS